MNSNLFSSLFLLLGLAITSCKTQTNEPTVVGPEPEPRLTYLGRDSIVTGDYRGIAIHASSDDAFEVLEVHRENKSVNYISAVNNYFADVADLKNRLTSFDWMVLDEPSDTPTGVQVQLSAGKVTGIRLNQGKELTQWPEPADGNVAIQIGDAPEILYEKLVSLSQLPAYRHKFQRVVLGAKYTYAILDTRQAALPWAFVYDAHTQGITEQVRMYFKDKKVQYILVDRFQRY